MTRQQRLPQWLGLISAIALLASIPGFPEPVLAQWWNPGSWFGQRDNRGISKGNRTGAAHRSGSCPKVAIPLTALAPLYQTDKGEAAVIGTTASDRPMLWFYVPYQIGDKVSAQLWQQERDPQASSQNEELYNERLIMSLPATTPGLVGIQLPDTESSLKVNTIYNWFLTVQCNPDDPSTAKFVDLSLVRVTPETAVPSAIAAAPPRKQLAAYTQRGLWNEAITVLNTARCNPTGDSELVDEWSNVLRAIGLRDIASISDVKCTVVR